jgi:hypothetical protein
LQINSFEIKFKTLKLFLSCLNCTPNEKKFAP